MSSGGRYAGRKAVITGGTHGIGRSVADALLDGGAEVLLTGRDEANIEEVRGVLAGRKAHVVRSDAGSMADIDALGPAVEGALGEVDLLFVNVGYAQFEPLERVTEDSFDRMVRVNVKGAFFTVQRLAPLVRPGGAIVLTTAVLVGMGFPASSVATACKAAVGAFAQTLASELLARGVRVNAVSPGFTQTPTMGVHGLSPEEREANQRLGEEVTPMGRHGSSEEIAAAVLFLAFDATFTTGSVLHADGGLGQGIPAPLPAAV